MRIIAGDARGRRLHSGKGRAIRPTAAKVKGAIFNVVASRFGIEGADVLDLFAGAGTLGIEALSRGARRVTFVEGSAAAVRILRANLDRCQFTARARVIRSPVTAALRRLRDAGAGFDGVLVDPPYDAGWVERTLRELGGGALLRPGGWVVIEHSTREAVGQQYGGLRLTQDRHYGKTALAILTAHGEETDEIR